MTHINKMYNTASSSFLDKIIKSFEYILSYNINLNKQFSDQLKEFIQAI